MHSHNVFSTIITKRFVFLIQQFKAITCREGKRGRYYITMSNPAEGQDKGSFAKQNILVQ